jgi:urease accessory protein
MSEDSLSKEDEAADTILLTQRLPADPRVAVPTLELDHAGRQRTRLRVEVEGRRYALLLAPGPSLADGELLADAETVRLRICARAEAVVVASTSDPCLLARAAWHLGNRHVPLEIGAGCLCLQPDHVLESLLAGLGLGVRTERRPFVPEPGAYHGGHAHAHSGLPFAAGGARGLSPAILRDGSPHER